MDTITAEQIQSISDSVNMLYDSITVNDMGLINKVIAAVNNLYIISEILKKIFDTVTELQKIGRINYEDYNEISTHIQQIYRSYNWVSYIVSLYSGLSDAGQKLSFGLPTNVLNSGYKATIALVKTMDIGYANNDTRKQLFDAMLSFANDCMNDIHYVSITANPEEVQKYRNTGVSKTDWNTYINPEIISPFTINISSLVGGGMKSGSVVQKKIKSEYRKGVEKEVKLKEPSKKKK